MVLGIVACGLQQVGGDAMYEYGLSSQRWVKELARIMRGEIDIILGGVHIVQTGLRSVMHCERVS